MANDFLNWLLGVAASIGITGIIGCVWRDSIGRFMTKSVEHRFDKKLESYKSEIRENEKELEHMREYLSSVRSGRDSYLQMRKFKSAENLIKARRFLNEFSMAVIFMKMFKIEALFENIDDPKIQGLIDSLVKPLNLDEKSSEYRKFDLDTPRLYLSDKTMRFFDIYSGIIMISVGMLKMLETKNKEASGIITCNNVVENIIDLLPSAKEDFEKYGDSFIFQLHDYFRRELLNEIKSDLTGASNLDRDTDLAAELALGVRNAEIKLKDAIAQHHIPDDLINTDANMV
ncbi:hypothetical protein ACRQPR_000893 [Citrobacter amalonaticus]